MKLEHVKIKDPNLQFQNYLHTRYATRRIIIHHTGFDGDWDARTIHNWHLGNGWAGIGYHFVIRQDGTIERGRPVDAIGAHCEGYNYDSIGIHLSGLFNSVPPTYNQIESTAMLIAQIARDFNLSIDRDHVFGHCEFSATDCPGKQLYNLLPVICGKANFYRFKE